MYLFSYIYSFLDQLLTDLGSYGGTNILIHLFTSSNEERKHQIITVIANIPLDYYSYHDMLETGGVSMLSLLWYELKDIDRRNIIFKILLNSRMGSIYYYFIIIL